MLSGGIGRRCRRGMCVCEDAAQEEVMRGLEERLSLCSAEKVDWWATQG